MKMIQIPQILLLTKIYHHKKPKKIIEKVLLLRHQMIIEIANDHAQGIEKDQKLPNMIENNVLVQEKDGEEIAIIDRDQLREENHQIHHGAEIKVNHQIIVIMVKMNILATILVLVEIEVNHLHLAMIANDQDPLNALEKDQHLDQAKIEVNLLKIAMIANDQDPLNALEKDQHLDQAEIEINHLKLVMIANDQDQMNALEKDQHLVLAEIEVNHLKILMIAKDPDQMNAEKDQRPETTKVIKLMIANDQDLGKIAKDQMINKPLEKIQPNKVL